MKLPEVQITEHSSVSAKVEMKKLKKKTTNSKANGLL